MLKEKSLRKILVSTACLFALALLKTRIRIR